MAQLNTIRYVVKKNDSLEAIALKHGYRSWRVLYDSQCNADFKRSHPNPWKINPGDNIYLPPSTANVLTVLQAKRRTLIAIKAGFNASIDEHLAAAKRDFDQIESLGKSVDVAAKVATIFKDVSGIVYKGWKAIALSGQELEKANRELTKEVLKFAYEPVAEGALSAYKDAKELDKNAITVFSQVTIKAYEDMTSPSFWANTIAQLWGGASWQTAVTTRPTDTYNAIKERILSQRERSNIELDKRINETTKLIQQFSYPVEEPLPIRVNPIAVP